MPVERPDYLPGGYYHVYNRGAHRASLFREEVNYLFVLERMKAYCRALELAPVAYCLLPNHYHFLIRQDGAHAAGLLPQRVFNSYSKAYNKTYGHSGTLFEGSYRVRHVTEEGYLMHLCRYIHLNAVLHGLVRDVEGWPYSNYLEWIGERNGTLVDRRLVAEHFSAVGSYRAFVQEYLCHRQLPSGLEYVRGWERA